MGDKVQTADGDYCAIQYQGIKTPSRFYIRMIISEQEAEAQRLADAEREEKKKRKLEEKERKRQEFLSQRQEVLDKTVLTPKNTKGLLHYFWMYVSQELFCYPIVCQNLTSYKEDNFTIL